MTRLTDSQKNLIFDYVFGLTSQDDASIAAGLIAASAEAAQVYASLKKALSPLDVLEEEQCPDYLAERTISRLNQCAKPLHIDLAQLLAQEHRRTVAVPKRFFPRVGQLLAAAATIVFVSGIMFSSLNFARQRSWQQQCQMQLSNIWTGVNNYKADNDGRLPAVATAQGSPWWKVGQQGGENQSNTRHLWLLVKNGYVNPSDFVCPAHNTGKVMKIDPRQINACNDFPSRNYVHYSFRIMRSQSGGTIFTSRQVLISDVNPLFENLPDCNKPGLRLKPDNKLLALNSVNHRRRGQNVLFSDGSVEFVRDRHIGISQDDIFTLRDVNVYEGVEIPSSEEDAFLAP